MCGSMEMTLSLTISHVIVVYMCVLITGVLFDALYSLHSCCNLWFIWEKYCIVDNYYVHVNLNLHILYNYPVLHN